MSKQHLRSLYLEKRAAIPPGQAHHAAAQLATTLLEFIKTTQAKTIAGYHPMRHELDILPALSLLAHHGYTTALPVIRHPHAPLTFHAWKAGEPLVPGSVFKRVLEPSHATPALLPDIILTPCVAFTQSGYRLGYGSGAYDRTLAAFHSLSIAIAYTIQEASTLPHDEFDQKVEWVATERGMVKT